MTLSALPETSGQFYDQSPLTWLPESCLDLVCEGPRRETANRRGSYDSGKLVHSHGRVPAGQNTYPQGSQWHQCLKLPAESCPRSSSDSVFAHQISFWKLRVGPPGHCCEEFENTILFHTKTSMTRHCESCSSVSYAGNREQCLKDSPLCMTQSY